MKIINSARAQIDAAVDLDAAFGAAWDVFELTRLVARSHADSADRASFAMWMSVIPPACEGRDAIGFAPSTPPGPGLPSDPDQLEGISEDHAADTLAELAGACAVKLRAFGPRANAAEDTYASARAAEAAEEICGFLSMDPQ
jgi:hypothetical protein